MSIKLKVVGCGDAFGSGGQMNTCYFVESPRFNFLIDCGGTSLPALKKQGIDISTIDAIFVSHFHGDHYGGIPYLLLNLVIMTHDRELTIVSPVGCKNRLEQLLALLYPGLDVLSKLKIEFIEFSGEQEMLIQKVKLNTFPMIHSEEALPHGFRIEVADKVISFSGDTEWTSTLIPLANHADLFICECNFFSKQGKGHLNFSTIKSKLNKLKADRILLSHFGEDMLHNLDKVDQEVAKEGMEIEL